MRKIRLSDTDLELFDIEILPTDYTFYQKHKDAFKTMWTEQGKSFWIRFVITFRSFTVKHGVIKQMNIDSPKFQNLIDQAFIFIHEQFVDGKVNIAKNFLEDLAQLAQNQDKFPGLDSKSFSKDPFYARDTRELFRKFFGMPDQKTSYLKVYILFPVYLRFGGSVCRALIRWVDAESMDPNDDSYWIPPQSQVLKNDSHDTCEHSMCYKCNVECELKFFCEKREGRKNGPRFLDFWIKGDPRFIDPENPFFAPHLNPSDDWRGNLTLETYRDFYQYAKMKYGRPQDKCSECLELRQSCDRLIQAYKSTKKKHKKKDGDTIDLDQLLGCTCENHNHNENAKDPSPQRKEKQYEKQKENKSASKNNKDKKSSERKSVFGKDATITNDYELALGTGMDLCPSKVAGFKVIKIEDKKNGLFEVNVSVASLKSDEEEKQHNEKMKNKMQKQLLNIYILNTDILRSKIDGLPKKLEWWEGRGFVIVVLNYETEEKEFTKKWTNFTLKISGFEEVPIKQMMIKLLHYVAKRKKRTCYGWNMVVDDVVTCMLPEDSEMIEDLSISIQRGFRFEDRLTEEEKDSLLKHQPNLRLDKVLMGMEAGEASKLLAEKGGKEKLKKMIAAVASREIYGDDLPVVDEDKLRKKLNNKVDITHKDIMWEQIMLNPEKFEFFVLMEKEKESELWELGMKSMDIRYFMSNKKPKIRICPVCKIVEKNCSCETPMVVSPDISKFMETSRLQEVKLLEEAEGQAMPKLSYREYKSYSMDGSDKPKKSKKSKEKKIELPDLPTKFKEVGIKSEKTTISIPVNQDTPLLGSIPIDSSEKPDKMTPVPGLTSSLNFTFQNGQKEQTITVSLGAYMPEEKLNLIADSTKLLKLCNEEEKRNEKALHRRKDEKKNKRDKSGKKKNASKDKIHPPANDPDIITVKSKEKQANIAGLLMNEFMGTFEAKDIERQLNQRLGVSTKKQNLQKKDNTLWAKYENNGEKVKTQVTDEKGDNTKESSSDNSSSEKDLASDVDIIEPETNNNKTTSKQREKVEKGEGKGSEVISKGLAKNELKSCWNCKVVEQKRKAFKKCQKCKDEGVLNCRYYCGRDCQVEDWKNRHKQEHKDGQLTLFYFCGMQEIKDED